MSDAPHSPAAFINAIAEEGTKDEAVKWLQKTWNDLTAARKEIEELRKDAISLWKLLDDIDTLDDACKDNDAIFRLRCYKIQRKRFEIMDGDAIDAAIDSAKERE